RRLCPGAEGADRDDEGDGAEEGRPRLAHQRPQEGTRMRRGRQEAAADREQRLLQGDLGNLPRQEVHRRRHQEGAGVAVVIPRWTFLILPTFPKWVITAPRTGCARSGCGHGGSSCPSWKSRGW